MGNSHLKNKKIKIPDEIMDYLNSVYRKYVTDLPGDHKGLQRARFILESGLLTYEELKSIKFFFDHISETEINSPEYILHGGSLMQNWVNEKLTILRDQIKTAKKIKADSGMENQFSKEKNTTPANPKPARLSFLSKPTSGFLKLNEEIQLNRIKKIIKNI